MKWISQFFGDLGGSLIGGNFYTESLSFSYGRRWRFLIIFLILISLIITTHFFGLISREYDKMVKLFEDNDYKVEFQDGIIANMPNNLKMIPVDKDTIAVWQWIGNWSDADSLRKVYPNIDLFVGPKAVFTYNQSMPRSTAYPASLTMTVDAQYLKDKQQGYAWLVFAGIFLISFLLSFPWAAVAIMLFIIPILVLKFSKMGMKFGMMWRLGMYLVSFHLLYVVIATMLRLNIPYGWIWNFPLYILVVAFLVKIDPERLESIRRPGVE